MAKKKTEKEEVAVKKNPVGSKVTKEFTFKLTEAEFSQLGKNAAEIDSEVQELELRFDEVKKEHQARIKTREAARDDTLAIIRAKEQTRIAEAVLVNDYDSKEKRYYIDGEVILAETMTEAELQMEFAPAKKPRASKQALKNDPNANLSGMTANAEEDEIGNVIKMETNKKTKRSAVDGAVEF